MTVILGLAVAFDYICAHAALLFLAGSVPVIAVQYLALQYIAKLLLSDTKSLRPHKTSVRPRHHTSSEIIA